MTAKPSDPGRRPPVRVAPVPAGAPAGAAPPPAGAERRSSRLGWLAVAMQGLLLLLVGAVLAVLIYVVVSLDRVVQGAAARPAAAAEGKEGSPQPAQDTQRPNAAPPNLAAFTEALDKAKANADDLGEALRKAKANTDGMEKKSVVGTAPAGKEIQDILNHTGRLLKSVPSLENFDEKINEFNRRLEQIRSTVAREAEPQNILIVVVHSAKLVYNRDCKEALIQLFRHQGVYKNHRVGLDVVITNQVFRKLGLTDDVDKTSNTQLDENRSTAHASENLNEGIVEELLKHFGEGTKARRCVVVASSDCPCPVSFPAWANLDARLDAVLLQADAGPNPERADNVKRWREFCEQKNGVCRVRLKAKDPKDMTRNLFRDLRELTAPLPILP